VLYLSLHQENWYPGTGHWEETGEGEGEGFTVNIPLPAETGDEGYKLLFEEVVVPLGERFAPELIVLSAGYDAHFADPLGGMVVTAYGFRTLTELVLAASRAGAGRVAAVLEGGYNLAHLPHAVLGTLEGFTGLSATTGEGTAKQSEAPYHLLRERARRARSMVHTYWNI
jgi:acetoin utilization deacetylase AcuC-like enzyme